MGRQASGNLRRISVAANWRRRSIGRLLVIVNGPTSKLGQSSLLCQIELALQFNEIALWRQLAATARRATLMVLPVKQVGQQRLKSDRFGWIRILFRGAARWSMQSSGRSTWPASKQADAPRESLSASASQSLLV